MSIRPYRGVLLFDIDGTLLDMGSLGRECLLSAVEDVFGARPNADDYAMCGRTDAGILHDLCLRLPPNTARAPRDDELQRLWLSYVQRLVQALPLRPPRPLPGVHALLEGLAYEGEWLCGLLTGNHQKVAWEKLESIGLAGYFRFGAFGHLHTQRNELAPLAMELARPFFKAEPKCMIIVGDTPRDIACAQAAGYKVIAVATGHYDEPTLAAHQPDLLLNSLESRTQLFAMLQRCGHATA